MKNEVIETSDCSSENITVKNKLGFDEWLAVSWALYWRYLIGLFCLFILVGIFGTISILLVKLLSGNISIFTQNLVAVISVVCIFTFFFIIVNILVLKWFFAANFNGFKILITDNMIPYSETVLNKMEWLNIFWSFLWRTLILSIGIFVLVFVVKIIIGSVLYKSNFINILVPASLDYQVLSLEVFVNTISFYIGFLSNIILVKWLFSLKNHKYKLIFIEQNNGLSAPVRNGLLTAILIIYFIGGIVNAFVSLFAIDLLRENLPFIFLHSQSTLSLLSSLSLIVSILVIPVWLWKKWAVFFLTVAFLIIIITSLLMACSVFILFPCMVIFFVFLYLVKKQWGDFE